MSLVNGTFEIPKDVANFVVSARLDGELAPLAATSKFLEGVYVEELGLFTIFGQIDPAGADVHLKVEITLLFENRPPRARAGADQTVECVSPGLTAVVGLSGADSFDLDGNDDIARHLWTVDLGSQDAEAAVGTTADASILVVSPEQAMLDMVTRIEQLLASTTDREIKKDRTQALRALVGSNPPKSSNGALDKLRAGNKSAAIAAMGQVVNWLERAEDDGADVAVLLAIADQLILGLSVQ